MWTDEHRKLHQRPCERYPSDLTDAEWAHLKPLIPPAKPGGRPRATDMREATNAILYVLCTGCPWRYMPTDFPPRSTVYNIFTGFKGLQARRRLDGDLGAPAHGLARGGGTRGEPDGRHPRQPVAQIG